MSEKRALVDRLAALAEEEGIPEGMFDDEVIELACAVTMGEVNEVDEEELQDELISEAERAASNINNGGFHSQFDYLIEYGAWGEDEMTAKEIERRIKHRV